MNLNLKIAAIAVATLFISYSSNAQSGTKWATAGNTASSGDFLGTTNAYGLFFRTNNLPRMSVSSNGTLQVNSLAGTGIGFVSLDASGNFIRTDFPNDATKVLTGNGTFQTFSSLGGWSFNGNNLYNTNSGFVGIGTNAPQYILDVNGDARVNGTLYAHGLVLATRMQSDTMSTGEITATGTIAAGSGGVKSSGMIVLNNNLNFSGGTVNEIYAQTGDIRMQSTAGFNGNTILNAGTNGNVGVGTATPQYKFDVSGDERVSGKIYANRIVPLPGDSVIKFGDSTLYYATWRNLIFSTPNSTWKGIAIGFGSYNSQFNIYGYNTNAYGLHSVAIGYNVSTAGGADQAMVLGSGVPSGPILINNIPYSIMMGSNSDLPTLYISPANGHDTYGQVGIQTKNPEGDFQVGDATNGNRKFLIRNDGKIIIGNQSPLAGSIFFNDPFTKLAVDGRIMCKDLYVSTAVDWPDYVFDSTYVLMPIDTVAKFINENKHLPESTNAATMEQNGFSLSENATTQQKQMEEMMLYIIQLNARMNALEKENAKLKAQGNK
jgi:hypothetical protein